MGGFYKNLPPLKTMSDNISRLNRFLFSQGLTLEGKALYRLVWSDTETEFRKGTFREFYGKIFLREFNGVREVKKYNYIHERWILEKWAPGNLTANRETPNSSNGDYIPVYVFEDSKGNYLPPNRKVLDFILAFMNGTIKQDSIPSEEYLAEKEVEKMTESMGDHPDFRTSGPTRNAVAYRKGVTQ